MRKPLLKLLAVVATASALAPVWLASGASQAAGWTPAFGRVAGSDRYATAAEASHAPNFDGIVFVASGQDYPDALAGGPAAAIMGGPLLLVPRTGTIPTSVTQELVRLKPDAIVIMGGLGAVDAGMARQLKGYTPYLERVAGANRYETAAMAADFAIDEDADGNLIYPTTVVLASGVTYADALSGGAGAARQRGPLLLTAPHQLPVATADVLKEFQPRYLKIIGGPGAVSATVEEQVRALLPATEVQRVAGADRYSTAVAAGRALVWIGSVSAASHVVLVNGGNFPDALAAAPLAAQMSAPVLLVKRECAPQVTVDAIRSRQVENVVAVGGVGVISDNALHLRACPA